MSRSKRKCTAAAIDAAPTVQGALFDDEPTQLAELSQWYTPPELAKRIAYWIDLPLDARVLEPSAGRGALIRPRAKRYRWTAVDIDAENCAALSQLAADAVRIDVVCGDFMSLTRERLGGHDCVIMNPPYEGDADVDHVLHALDFAPRVVALLRSAFRHGSGRWSKVWRHVRPVRIAELIDRPKFGKGLTGDSPMSDFAVFDLVRRDDPIPTMSACETTIAWWYSC